MSAPTTARRVSGLERVWLAAARLAPPFAIHLVAEWPGPLDPDRWRAAIEAAAGPAMRLRLRGVLRGARWITTADAIPIEVVSAPWDGAGPADWLTAPLPPARAPLRVHLLPAAPVARVVFSAHHALTDGRGLWRLLADTTRALAGEPVTPPAAGPLTDTDLARDLGVAPLEPLVDDAAPIRPVADRPITWRRRRLPAGPDVLARLAAAFAAEVPGKLRLGLPVDLRRYAPGLDSAANLTGVLHLDLPPAPTPAAIRAALAAGLADRTAARHPLAADAVRGYPLWLMAAVGRAVAKKHLRTQGFGTSVTLSHLGRHALTVDGHPLRVAFIPPGAPGLPLFVGITADPDGVELAAAGPHEPAVLDDLLTRVAARWTAG